MYYDYNKILSYGAMLNFLIGERGVGKTYRCFKICCTTIFKKTVRNLHILEDTNQNLQKLLQNFLVA